MWLRDGVRSRLVPDGPALFANCHASTIVRLDDGDLLAAFFAGTREGTGDTAIWLVRCKAGVWQSPVRCFADPGTAHWNPVLHSDGVRVWLFYKNGPTVHDWITWFAASPDGGRCWDTSRPLVPGDTAPRGPVRNKLIVLDDGSWLAPGSVETSAYWDAFTDRSKDLGASWVRADVPLQHVAPAGQGSEPVWQGLGAQALWETDPARVFAWDGVIQPSLWQSAPGQVHMLMRSTRGHVYRADSTDGGASWGAAQATDLPNNNSGLDLVRLDDGRLVLACNPVMGNWGRRTPMSLLGSADNGHSWERLIDLETEDGEFSYPAIIAEGGRLDVTYTWNRTDIIHWRFGID